MGDRKQPTPPPAPPPPRGEHGRELSGDEAGRAIAEAFRRRCDHKFIDSNTCAKCGVRVEDLIAAGQAGQVLP